DLRAAGIYHARPLEPVMTIPATVSASRAVAHGERYEGEIPMALLERLREFAPGRVDARLEVGKDAGGREWLRGQVEGELRLQCQVCLRPYPWSFALPVDLVLVRSESDEERLLAD